MQSLSPEDCGYRFFVALRLLAALVIVSFGFFFAPGWANGWPGGLTIYQVWSTWLTVTFFVMLMTCGICLGSLVSLLFCLFPRGQRHTGNVFGAWMVIWTILSAVSCASAFREIYGSTLEMWPNGYPG
jgi:hypothetical protein